MAHTCKYKKYKKPDAEGRLRKRWLCRGCGEPRPNRNAIEVVPSTTP